MTITRTFQPRRASFLFRRILRAVILLSVLSVALFIGAMAAELPQLLGALPVLWIVVGVPLAYAAHVAFTKERYEIHPEHLVCHRGSLLSDARSELEIRNVTHVRLRLPFVRYWLFGIGDVRVESAGSAASEITFESVVGPEAVFAEVMDLMRANGYSLEQNEVLHEESPGVVGALTDVVQVGIGGGFSVLVFALLGAGMLADLGSTGGSLLSTLLALLGAGTAVVGTVTALGGLVVRYLDVTRRTYTVYDDAVAYTEGFLTRDNAVIPFENIADASTTRTLVDQILGLYDVKISCQGSGSEIAFRRLSRGKELEQAIGTLVARGSAKSRTRQAKPTPVSADHGPAEQDAMEPTKRGGPAARQLVDPAQAWTMALRMNPTRAQLPLLFILPVFPVWVFAAVATAIRSARTTYTVGPNTLASSYSFLGSQQQEFAYDKVTGVQVDRSPFDRLMKTLSVQIWSIGSPRPLNLTCLDEATVDLPALLRQCGIPSESPAEGALKQSFGPRVWLIQNAFLLLFLTTVALGVVVAALFAEPLLLLFLLPLVLLPVPMAVVTALRVKQQRITFHREHVEAQTGVFFRKHIYARYDNVKKVESTQIPFTNQGRLKLYVAGEHVVHQQKGQEGGAKVPYSLEGSYIEGIADKTDAVDALMLGRTTPARIEGRHPQDDDVLMVSKPAIANSVVPLALVGLFFPPLWLSVPFVAYGVKVRTYSVESDRVVARGGIFFKYATSVLFDRIDALQQHQGALGKAFGNGVVTILTAGSSAPDLSVANIPDYQAVYASIRKHYGKPR